jgi:hypothetical protein
MRIVSPGDQFGYWTVIEEGPRYLRPGRSGTGDRRWCCRCRCGTERNVHEHLLLNGKSISCTCSRWRNSIRSIMGQLIITETGCAIWPGSKHGGYGVTSLQGKQQYVHRLLYEHFVGSVPERLVLDHIICDNRACANWTHLRVCTDGENVMRSDSPIAQNARKTHCVRGHPFSGTNLQIQANGWRKCHACDRARRQEAVEKKKAAGIYVPSGKWQRAARKEQQ